MLQLLTATGMRPEAWALCERWMMRQTYIGPVRWIIVDDGQDMQRITFEREGWALVQMRPQPFWTPGQNTQARNLLIGLTAVEREHPVIVVEDDDWYAPDWLAHCDAHLVKADLVGEVRARYYNVERHVGRRMNNRTHSSLCSTAARGAALDAFWNACRSSSKFIDICLWQSFGGRKSLFGGDRVCGIKGLPGRDGIGCGHRRTFSGSLDKCGRLLYQWIGDDAGAYL